jgi:hypothetical protein
MHVWFLAGQHLLQRLLRPTRQLVAQTEYRIALAMLYTRRERRSYDGMIACGRLAWDVGGRRLQEKVHI